MKNIRFYTLIFILLGIIFSCKKKEYPASSTDNSPVFSFTGNVGGVPISLQSGINDYYMYSSYTQNANNVYEFIGNLKKTTSSTGIQIQINDDTTTALNGYAQINTALTVGDYPFYAGTPGSTSYNVQFNSSFNNVALTHSWYFGDGGTAYNIVNPSHIFKKSGMYNVSLNVMDSTYCSDSLSNIQKINVSGDNCKTMIAVTNYSNNTITFTQSSTGTGSLTYLWDFGDGSTSPLPLPPAHTYTTPGRYLVSLKVTDSNNNIAISNFHALTQTSSLCTTNYSVTSVNPVANPLAFSNIVITWTDASGNVYTSNNALQPASSYFKIISVDNYHNNDNNQTVKKLHVKFNCTVYNGGSSLVINNGDAVIVVAYK